jgi:hypothetical protein
MLKRFSARGEFYLWRSGFDYTDIVKCVGNFFLKVSFLNHPAE